jgi:hypothetical protein
MPIKKPTAKKAPPATVEDEGRLHRGPLASGEDLVQMTVLVPRQMQRRFKAQAAEEGFQMGELVRRWMLQYIQERQAQQAEPEAKAQGRQKTRKANT